AWQPATVTVVDPGGYWSWTYIWALPEADNGVYTISARATISGAIGTVDTITVTIKNNVNLVYLPLVMRRFPAVPYPPVLNEISNADLDGNYTVSWAYNGPYDVQAPTSYTLQESTSADFSTGVQETTFSASTTSMNVTGKASATYYYRVRGNNTAGAGEWSNVRSVVVMSALTDDFSNSGSGWPVATYKRGDGGDLMRVEYVDGTYRMKIMLATSDQNNYKMGLVKAPDRFIPPSANYDVSVSHFFAQAEMPFPGYAPSEGKAGIVFAANADYTTLYVFEWNWEGACAVNRYNSVSWPVSGYSGYGGSMTWTKIRDWGSCSNLLGGSYNQTNRLLVEVRDNRATVYVYNNGVKTQIASFTDDALRTHRRVGLITGSWKWTPVESRFDNFKLEIK
ncbi:MAG TPA: fibronectin type III domain-containing protein, partial [Anaerolineae bacterium]|nr:fibronectin type III domain-containing protein [Anaerolineae bacterium]